MINKDDVEKSFNELKQFHPCGCLICPLQIFLLYLIRNKRCT